jgi:NAD(P)-dependent dehydrogenase (short-subunit alcohol dehydrogenase family)
MDEQTVAVTGGSRGIGEAVVRALLAEGAHVVTCGRDAGALADLEASVEAESATEDEYESEGEGTLTTQRADVRDEYDVERFVETAAREGGGIDAVVANAGVYHGDPGETDIAGETYATFDDHLRTNVRGVFATFREAVPHLTDDPRLLALSGRIAREATAGMGSYAVSKAAAEAVVRQFAADTDLPAAVVDPGTVATDLTGGKGMDPERAAPLVVWALEDADTEALDGGVLDRRSMRQG